MKLGLFTTKDVYIKLYKNEIEITRLDTGKTVREPAIVNFSNNKLVFADFENAEISLKYVLDSMFRIEYKFTPALNILIQVLDHNEEGLSTVEERALLDSCKHINGKNISVLKGNNPISNSHALNYIQQNLKKSNL